MQGLTEGRLVHYVLATGDGVQYPGEHRPAVVVKVWDRDPQGGTGSANLVVFLDGCNDIPSGGPGNVAMTMWATSRVYSEQGSEGTWHWPEKV